MKTNNISPNLRSILIFSVFLSIFSNTFSATNQNFLYNQIVNKRNLDYGLNSIYYTLAYPSNNLTGTGDKLKDVAYKVLSKLMACDSGCCVGEIDNLRCGDSIDCKIYLDYSRTGNVVAAVIVPVFVMAILIFLFFLYAMKFKLSYCSSFGFTLLSVFIITIPCIIFYLHKKDSNVTPIKNKEK